MFGKKVKYRLLFFITLLTLVSLILFLILNSLEKNVVFFFSPTEINNTSEINFKKKIRLGGIVKEKSIEKKNNSINFIITDYTNEIIVSYVGSVPNLFSEGKGVVAEGILKDKKFFIADKILAKHDENYMPPEVSKILNKKSN
tara:strand:- start:769 stop:1197 length:429 start_codon:yes stop_codon:yes gene_type:complete